MAFSLNKIMLIGNLGQDAETRFTTSNASVTSFSLATTNGYKGKDGNWVNETTWHNITAWNLPDFYKDVLKKGKKFYVEGRLAKEEYTDKDGAKKTAIKVISSNIIPLEGKESTGHSSNYDSTSQYQAPEENNSLPDDDLPF